ncbi:MAG: hypothetical protein E6K10_02890 [Methanobacteriota archaeon]|nr:MAG: hypothetical protein E6K10_02890 [Euryarchaeota archaeon]
MAKVIEPEDLQALSIAMTIRKYERLGKADMFARLRRKLRLTYGERGNRIYVFYSSGLLKEFLEPLLVWVEITPTPTDIDRARRVFDRCIEHMDYAVYVNAPMTHETIVEQLAYRFRVDRVAVVLVFGRSRAIVHKIRKAVATFIENEKEHQLDQMGYDVREESFAAGDVEALTLTIAVKGREDGK